MPDNQVDVLQSGKRRITVNIKTKQGQELVKSLTKVSDVLIDPYRPGIMEKLGLGPDDLFKVNSKLIYARLTGYGQTGPYALQAGHDINYVAMSGVLSLFGRSNEKPTPPVNYAADFAGGGLLCAFGICLALLERHHSGKGQVVDNSMTEGVAYVASWLLRSQHLPLWGEKRGNNWLDSGAHYYDTYETKDGKYMAVGAVEAQFYSLLLKGLGLPSYIPQHCEFEAGKELFTKTFLTKTQKEWTEIFDKSDACVTPVLEWNEARDNHQHKERNSFVNTDNTTTIPNPAPTLSRTPGVSSTQKMDKSDWDWAVDVLGEIGLSQSDIKNLADENILRFKEGSQSKL